MKYTYEYTGEGEVHLPSVGKLVKKTGEIVESGEKINHPDFEEVKTVKAQIKPQITK